MNKLLKSKARFLTLVLRHKPEEANITLDYNGAWANISDIMRELDLTHLEILEIVGNDNKGRFGISKDDLRIRANQGHSVEVDLELQEKIPPEYLLHGTPEKFKDIIIEQGIKRMQRHHVHLSSNIETATQVAERRGKAIILTVKAKIMAQDGYKFYQSENGVWLTDSVPAKYLEIQNV